MKTKLREKSTKINANKKKSINKYSQFMAKAAKSSIRIKKNSPKSDQFSKGNLLCRALVFIMIMLPIVAAYIYIEGSAQAAPGGQNQSRMQIIYRLYNGPASYYKKQIVKDVLASSGVKDNLCVEIAAAIVDESNKTNIPVEMYLAIMKKESSFRSRVVSSAHAKGIMQIQVGTWDAYVEKHNLPVTRDDIFLPQANIMVASVILKELYDYYAKLGYEEQEIWDYVLAAYYAGPASLRSGIKSYHRRYIEKVKEYYSDFELQISA